MFYNLDLNDVVIVTSSAEASYSGATIYEFAVIPQKLYNENKALIDQFQMSYCELDGKHSEIDASIDIKLNPTIEEMNQIISSYSDVSTLIDMISELLKIDGRDLYNLKALISNQVKEINEKLLPDDLELIELIENQNIDIINKLIINKKVINYFLNKM